MNQYLKKIVPIILWGLTMPLSATPLPDKITVSHRYITVLIFESPVCAVNIASQDYAAKIQGNYLMLRCRKPKAPPTSIFVTYQEEQAFLHAQLCFDSNATKTYDLRAAEQPPSKANPQSAPIYFPGIATPDNLPQVYYHLGVRAEGMTLIVTNVLNDDKHTYLRVYVRNRSGVDYNIEQVSFCFHSGQRKQVGVSPVYSAPQRCIPAYEADVLMYVLPLYGIKKRGRLCITWREAQGERTLRLSIPARVLLQAPQYTAQPTS